MYMYMLLNYDVICETFVTNLVFTCGFLLCTRCFNILDSRVEKCVTGELSSFINLWLEDYGYSPY